MTKQRLETDSSDRQNALPPQKLLPRENGYFLGHEKAENIVLNRWLSGSFPHAWLINGPRGIGKASFAYRLARFILTPNDLRVEASPPNSLDTPSNTPTFRQIAAGGHANFRVLALKSKTVIPVEEIRKAIDFSRQTAAEDGWKIILVDSVDDLNHHGQNAILKILEEPTPRTVFLLVSHSPGKLLSTLRSRCCKLTLSCLPENLLIALIQYYRPETSLEDIQAITALSGGSIGYALEFLDDDGMRIYRSMLCLVASLEEPDYIDRVYDFADMFGKKNNYRAFEIFTFLFNGWFTRLLLAPMQNIPEKATDNTTLSAVNDQERKACELVKTLGGIEMSLALWERLSVLLSQAGAPAHLDKRQIIVNLFLSLQKKSIEAKSK